MCLGYLQTYAALIAIAVPDLKRDSAVAPLKLPIFACSIIYKNFRAVAQPGQGMPLSMGMPSQSCG